MEKRGTRESVVSAMGEFATVAAAAGVEPCNTRSELVPAPGMRHASALRLLDRMHGESGRLVYDCDPYALVGGGICK